MRVVAGAAHVVKVLKAVVELLRDGTPALETIGMPHAPGVGCWLGSALRSLR
jgi:hypothetical protein